MRLYLFLLAALALFQLAACTAEVATTAAPAPAPVAVAVDVTAPTAAPVTAPAPTVKAKAKRKGNSGEAAAYRKAQRNADRATCLRFAAELVGDFYVAKGPNAAGGITPDPGDAPLPLLSDSQCGRILLVKAHLGL